MGLIKRPKASDLRTGVNVDGVVGTLEYILKFGDLQVYADTAYSNLNSGITSFNKLKSVQVKGLSRVASLGNVLVTFDIQKNTAQAGVISGRLYVNGVARGTIWNPPNRSETTVYTFSEIIYVEENDIIQLYVAGNTNTGVVSNRLAISVFSPVTFTKIP